MSRSQADKTAPFFRSALQARVLAAITAHPGEWFTIRELIPDGRTQQGVLGEVRRLVDAGIVEEDRSRRAFAYRYATDSPVATPLRELVERTVGIEAQLRAAFEHLPGLTAAAIYGSWAAGTISAESDVDVLVLADEQLDPVAVSDACMAVSERARRDVNPSVFGVAEVQRLRKSGSGFITQVMRSPLIDLVGDVAAVIEGGGDG